LDCLDFLRQRGLRLWAKNEPQAQHIRSLAYKPGRSYETYPPHVHAGPEPAANTLICLTHQATYLLRRQLAAVEDQFLDEGGFTERLYSARKSRRLRRR
jgi:four helix bundle suffix protein